MIWGIADLHLGRDMSLFGRDWHRHAERIASRWQELVRPSDTVIIAGDVSWAMRLAEAAPDLEWLDRLPGQKILVRGNHDYWWKAIGKLRALPYRSLRYLQNDHVVVGKWAVCGSRGWVCPGEEGFGEEDLRIYLRELERLRLSLASVQGSAEKIMVTLHFPPVNSRREPSGFTELCSRYEVRLLVYGHLHGRALAGVTDMEINGLSCRCLSADHINFRPIPLAREND